MDKVLGVVRLFFFLLSGWCMVVALGCLLNAFILMARGHDGTTMIMMGVVSILAGCICVLFCIVLGEI